MSENDKKIIKGIVSLLVLGAFCKLGFDVNTYLSIQDTVEDAKTVLILFIVAAVLLIVICVVAFKIKKEKDIAKKRQANRHKRTNTLENQMMGSNRNVNRNNQYRQNR